MTDTDKIDDRGYSDADVSHGIIKGMTTSTGATMYDGLADAHMSFNGIGCLESCAGDVILRGRNGQRDVLFPLEKAVQRYFEWMDLIAVYARNGINGWQEAMDIAKDFRAKILEAAQQRRNEGRPVPPDVIKLEGSVMPKKEA
jgi:hypothetical protein